MKRKDQCPGCGVPYAEHPGAAETCKRLDLARGALRIISTWATFQNGIELVPEHVARLCSKTLEEIR